MGRPFRSVSTLILLVLFVVLAWLFRAYIDPRLFSLPASLLLTAVTLYLARSRLRDFPVGQGTWRITRRTDLWSKRLAIVGALLFVFAFVWGWATLHVVPDSDWGAAILFGPAILFIFSGVGLIGFRVLIWTLGVVDREQ
jgi:hypothetical protein